MLATILLSGKQIAIQVWETRINRSVRVVHQFSVRIGQQNCDQGHEDWSTPLWWIGKRKPSQGIERSYLWITVILSMMPLRRIRIDYFGRFPWILFLSGFSILNYRTSDFKMTVYQTIGWKLIVFSLIFNFTNFKSRFRIEIWSPVDSLCLRLFRYYETYDAFFRQ